MALDFLRLACVHTDPWAPGSSLLPSVPESACLATVWQAGLQAQSAEKTPEPLHQPLCFIARHAGSTSAFAKAEKWGPSMIGVSVLSQRL